MAKKTSSSQKLLPRKPRVQIEYDVEVGDALRQVELPWITGVMADLSGANAGELPELSKRKFSDVDSDNFDSFLKDQKPRLTFAVDNLVAGEGRMGVDVTLESMADFSPDVFARKIGAEIIEIIITEDGKGSDRRYVFDATNPHSAPLGESVASLDALSKEFIAYKIGEKAADLESSILPDPRNTKRWTLRIVKKGPLAKLLDARNRLKELLIKVDGKAGAQKALDELLQDKSVMEGLLKEQAPSSEAP